MNDRQVAPRFWLSEFINSDTAVRLCIPNQPGEKELACIVKVLAPGMQAVRDLLDKPVVISSGYRSPTLNRAIGGSQNSQHMQGLAADFTAPEFGPPLTVCRKILAHKDEIGFDQLIFEGRWVHISFAPLPAQRRGQVLTAQFCERGVQYLNGLPA